MKVFDYITILNHIQKCKKTKIKEKLKAQHDTISFLRKIDGQEIPVIPFSHNALCREKRK